MNNQPLILDLPALYINPFELTKPKQFLLLYVHEIGNKERKLIEEKLLFPYAVEMNNSSSLLIDRNYVPYLSNNIFFISNGGMDKNVRGNNPFHANVSRMKRFIAEGLGLSDSNLNHIMYRGVVQALVYYDDNMTPYGVRFGISSEPLPSN